MYTQRHVLGILLIITSKIVMCNTLKCQKSKRSSAENEQTILTGDCFLSDIFMQNLGTAMDSILQDFLLAKTALCTEMSLRSSVGMVSRHHFVCHQRDGLVLLQPRYLQTYGKTLIEITTDSANYVDMAIKIEGKFRSLVFTAEKVTGKLDFELNSAGKVDIETKVFLKLHFNVSVQSMKVLHSSPGADLAFLPSSMVQCSINGLFQPNKHFELNIFDHAKENFLIMQNFAESIKPAVSFMKPIKPNKNTTPLSIINRVYGMKMMIGFAPFLELTDLLFTSSTATIGVIMDQYHRDIAADYTTESTRFIIPKGKQIRWLIGDIKEVKKNTNFIPLLPETNGALPFGTTSKGNEEVLPLPIGLKSSNLFGANHKFADNAKMFPNKMQSSDFEVITTNAPPQIDQNMHDLSSAQSQQKINISLTPTQQQQKLKVGVNTNKNQKVYVQVVSSNKEHLSQKEAIAPLAARKTVQNTQKTPTLTNKKQTTKHKALNHSTGIPLQFFKNEKNIKTTVHRGMSKSEKMADIDNTPFTIGHQTGKIVIAGNAPIVTTVPELEGKPEVLLTKGNKRNTAGNANDIKNFKRKQIAKRSNDAEKYSENIALEMHFPKDGKMLTVTAADYLKGNFQDIIWTFFPGTQALFKTPTAAEIKVGNKNVAITVTDKRVVFSKIQIDTLRKEVHVRGLVDENWWVAGKMVNLKGLNVSAVSSIPESESSSVGWKFQACGHIQLFSKLVKVHINEESDEYVLSGDFQLDNMTDLLKAANDASFLTDAEKRSFKHLSQLPFTKLSLSTKINDPILRVQALTPDLHGDHHSERKNHVEILFKNYEGSDMNVVVGLCRSNVKYECMMKGIFNQTIQGVSWLMFKKVCFQFAKSISNENSYFVDPLLKDIPVEPGIKFVGELEAPSMCTVKGEDSDEIDSTDPMCSFLKKNPHIFTILGDVDGIVTTTSHVLKSKSASESSQVLANSKLEVQGIQLKLVDVEFPPDIRRNLFINDGDGIRNTSLLLFGNFKSITGAEELSFEGEISIGKCGQLEISITRNFAWSPPDTNYFKLEDYRDGHNMRKDNDFNTFVIHSPIRAGLPDGPYSVKFDVNPRLHVNIAIPINTFLVAHKKPNNNNIKAILKAFGKEMDHVMFSNGVSYGRTSVVFNRNGAPLAVQEIGGVKACKGLNFFGQVHYKNELSNFKIVVSGEGLFQYTAHLPVINASSGHFVFVHSKKNPHWGPLLTGNSSIGESGFKVKVRGYLQTIGIIEENVDVSINSNGAFLIDFGGVRNFFDEAPANILLEEKDGFSKIENMKVELTVNLMPDKQQIEMEVKDYFLYLANKVKDVLSDEHHNDTRTTIERSFLDKHNSFMLEMHELKSTIQVEVEKIRDTYRLFNEDCVDSCNAKGTIKVPGLRFDDDTQKMVLDSAMYETANVVCIAACEASKSEASHGFAQRISAAKRNVKNFDLLSKKMTEFERFYGMYSESFDCQHAALQMVKDLIKDVPQFHEKILSANDDFFELKHFLLSKPLANVNVGRDKCVEGFDVRYKVLGTEGNFILKQCFNGEYQFYFAQKLLDALIGRENSEKFQKVMKRNEMVSAIFSEEYRVLSNGLRLIMESHSEEDISQSVSEMKRIRNTTDSLLMSYKLLEVNQLKRRTLKRRVFSDLSQHTIPTLELSHIDLLRESRHCVTRSAKTRRALLYSSPWAAIDSFNPWMSLDKAKLQVRSIKNTTSRCDYMNHIVEQYKYIYNIIHSVTETYLRSSLQLNALQRTVGKNIADVKSNIAGRSFNTTSHQTTLFWLRQVEKGMVVFSRTAKRKLQLHSNTAINTLRRKYETTLKKEGIPSIGVYMDVLMKGIHRAFKRTNILSSGVLSASRMSNGLLAMFSNPNLSLNQVTSSSQRLRRHLVSINQMYRECH